MRCGVDRGVVAMRLMDCVLCCGCGPPNGNRVTITGNDSADPEVRVVRGDRPLDVVSHNHTVVVFRVPPGESAHNNLTVTVFNQVSSAVLFTYNPPVITELQDASGAPLVYGSCCRYDEACWSLS